MLLVVVIALSLSLLIVLAAVVFVFCNVAFTDPQSSPPRSVVTRKWQPPRLKGDDLQTWAAGVAEEATLNRLAGSRVDVTAGELVKEVNEGAAYAIHRSPQGTSREREGVCPNRQMIAVTPPEVIALADEIRRNKPTKEVAWAYRCAQENSKKTAELDHREYANAEIVCPLLAGDDVCTVFPDRPIFCRGWRPSCSEPSNGCGLKSLNEDSDAFAVAQGVAAGLSHGLEKSGLDGAFYELNSALFTALDTPDAAERWISGESVFEECKLYR